MPGQRNSDIGVRFVSDEAKRDHRDLEDVYQRMMASLTTATAAHDGAGGERNHHESQKVVSELQGRFCWGLARHLIAYQLFVFPGTESRAKEGSKVAVERKRDLALIGDQLIAFSKLAPSDPDFKASAEQIAQFLRGHIRVVERTDMVAIEKALDGEESERMGRDWERTEVLVPRGMTMGGRGGDLSGGGGGEREEEVGGVQEKREEDPPYKTVGELLSAPVEDVRRTWERLAR